MDDYFKMKPIKTNSRGLRDKEYPLEKPPGTYRVAVIGDSFTFGDGVNAEEVYHSILEERLNRLSDSLRFEFINFGLAGYDLLNYLGVVEHKAMAYDPDLILIGFCGNNDDDLPEAKQWTEPFTRYKSPNTVGSSGTEETRPGLPGNSSLCNSTPHSNHTVPRDGIRGEHPLSNSSGKSRPYPPNSIETPPLLLSLVNGEVSGFSNFPNVVCRRFWQVSNSGTVLLFSLVAGFSFCTPSGFLPDTCISPWLWPVSFLKDSMVASFTASTLISRRSSPCFSLPGNCSDLTSISIGFFSETSVNINHSAAASRSMPSPRATRRMHTAVSRGRVKHSFAARPRSCTRSRSVPHLAETIHPCLFQTIQTYLVFIFFKTISCNFTLARVRFDLEVLAEIFSFLEISSCLNPSITYMLNTVR